MKSSLPLAFALSSLPACVDEPTFSIEEVAIVGGARTAEHPAVVYIHAQLGPDTSSGCTGTLISKRVVLTAAHCLQFDAPVTQHLAYFGTDVTDPDNDPGRLGLVNVASFLGDAQFDRADAFGGHDFGLLLLEADAPVAPIPLAGPLDATLGASLTVVGWGITGPDQTDGVYKREVVVPVREVRDVLLGIGGPGMGTCSGDSGGPHLLPDANGALRLAGVTSFGDAACDVNWAGRVDRVKDTFILPYVAEHDPDGLPATGDPDAPAPGTPDEPRGTLDGGCASSRAPSSSLVVVVAVVAIALIARARRQRRRDHAVATRHLA